MTTKGKTTLLASTVNAAGATVTSGWINISSAPKSSVVARVVNGATGPTSGCTARVDFSPDGGGTIYLGAGGHYTWGIVAADDRGIPFDLAEDTMYVRISFYGNAGQSVTVQADITSVTAL